MQNRFIELVLEEKKKGTTVFMSSHIFEEIEKTCDRMAFIKNGMLGSVKEMDLLKQTRKKIFQIMFAKEEETNSFLKAFPAGKRISGLLAEIAVQQELRFFLRRLSDFQVRDITIKEENLEDIFLNYYGGASK